MKEVAKYLYRLFFRLFILPQKRVTISNSTRFNQNTKLEGFNRIGKNSCITNSDIGSYSFIGDNSHLSNCSIGRYCSIAADVNVVTGTHPSHVFVSSSPLFYSVLGQCNDVIISKNYFNERLEVDGKSAIIGNDVWIGQNVLIKGGIRIHDGAIIAMGAVVTKDVPPYAIVGGVPAKIIGYRFSDNEIEFLLRNKWWNKDRTWIENHVEEFHNIKEFCNTNSI